jgi:uncharacterized protein YlxW (UPF0749 family)
MSEKKMSGKYWLGSGKLGKCIMYGDEIPADLLSPERMKKLIAQKKIGDKLKPTADVESDRVKEIAELKQENKELSKKVKSLESKIAKLEAEKLEAEKLEAEKAEAEKLEAEKAEAEKGNKK